MAYEASHIYPDEPIDYAEIELRKLVKAEGGTMSRTYAVR
jgi:hypothetical protein